MVAAGDEQNSRRSANTQASHGVNESDPPLGPFAVLYEAWVEAYLAPRDPRLEEQLAAAYREAWHNEVGWDREYILYFIHDHKDQSGADLIIEGLRSEDARVARVAATIASATHRRVFDLGPDLRKVYRDLVRRFPENDTIRPRDLYGHKAGDDDDSDERPFVNLYEDWMADEYPRDPALTRQLADTYRHAWATGDNVVRAFVLHFLLTNSRPKDPAHKVNGADLVAEGLKSSDPRLARTAAFAAWRFLEVGVHLGPDTRRLLEVVRERFPDTRTAVWGAFRALDEFETTSP